MRFLLLLVFAFLSLAQAKMTASYSIAYVGMSMDYREYDRAGTIQDSESSDYSELSGVDFGYTFNLQDEDNAGSGSISFHTMVLNGTTRYVGAEIGSQCDSYGCVKSKSSNSIYDISCDLTSNYAVTQESEVQLSLGFGYRYWLRELSSYQEEGYEWFSVRPAIGFLYTKENFSINPKIEYQYGIRPRMSVTGFDEDFKLGSANIVEVSLPMEYAFNQKFSLYGSFVYQYQKIAESSVIVDGYGDMYLEPDSTTKNKYIKFGVAFKY